MRRLNCLHYLENCLQSVLFNLVIIYRPPSPPMTDEYLVTWPSVDQGEQRIAVLIITGHQIIERIWGFQNVTIIVRSLGNYKYNETSSRMIRIQLSVSFVDLILFATLVTIMMVTMLMVTVVIMMVMMVIHPHVERGAIPSNPRHLEYILSSSGFPVACQHRQWFPPRTEVTPYHTSLRHVSPESLPQICFSSKLLSNKRSFNIWAFDWEQKYKLGLDVYLDLESC